MSAAIDTRRALLAEVYALLEHPASCERCGEPADVVIGFGQREDDGTGSDQELTLCLVDGLDLIVMLRQKGRLARRGT